MPQPLWKISFTVDGHPVTWERFGPSLEQVLAGTHEVTLAEYPTQNVRFTSVVEVAASREP